MKRFLKLTLSNSGDMFTRLAISFGTVLIVCFGGLLFFSFAMRLAASPATLGRAPDSDVVAYPQASNTSTHLSVLARLGRKMFFDPSLSHSGRLACASCHNPANAYAPANGLSVQLGGPDLKNYGVRAVPSLTYLEHTPTFTIGPNSAIPDTDAPPAVVMPTADTKVASLAKADKTNTGAVAAESAVPQGGLNWDGRAETVQAQAFLPLLDPNEMDNHDRAEILDHLKNAAYADDIKKLFGANIFKNPGLALDESIYALVRFQFEDPSFHLYNSKYDAYLAGKATLTVAEERGRKLFDDPKKGNCSSCHIDKPSRDGLFRPAFTDYQFEALGAPRNLNVPATHDPHYYDLGLCGPYRKDYATAKPYCGLFKTPTLRNVATRRVFFHNGYFHSLRDVLHFYVERETDSGKWYPKRADGSVDRYDDLPAEYKKNLDVVDAPFDRKMGDKPALNDAEINDIIAFLKTLTDGYGPTAAMNSGKQAHN